MRYRDENGGRQLKQLITTKGRKEIKKRYETKRQTQDETHGLRITRRRKQEGEGGEEGGKVVEKIRKGKGVRWEDGE